VISAASAPEWIKQLFQSGSGLDIYEAAKPQLFAIARGAVDPPQQSLSIDQQDSLRRT